MPEEDRQGIRHVSRVQQRIGTFGCERRMIVRWSRSRTAGGASMTSPVEVTRLIVGVATDVIRFEIAVEPCWTVA